MSRNPVNQVATLGGGCFWCLESAFAQVEGIIQAESGYAGGHVANPTYQDICTGESGHAEVVRLTYDPQLINYRDILEIYFSLHDPTQLDRQGNDIGPQYRSVIFFHNDEQCNQAASIIAEMSADNTWPEPVVTAVEEVSNYYPAEAYHRSYYENNSQQPYCAMVVGPKLAKFKQNFANRLKSS
ncbi:peptide-methionine (S)-S-oxide reductase [Aliidiomarina minuta]|uniref:Peptide methionine sulfoxide reductase MsrA n=1 Tax=Aliidiomarina minuta TaxID=880057 RepID=A0A432WA14_9GAMM|nr:peptide-methionine (S)-S-oxide reductase [Aliidiomarina minuta]